MIQVNKKFNKIQLKLVAYEMGKDVCIILTGGKSHLGSITIGVEGINKETFIVGKHKEYIITEKLGEMLKNRYCGNFVICCGIHIDNITEKEIEDIINLSCKMMEKVCVKLKIG
ncbi:hypothetical protein LN736_17635 [Clostridium sp. WLY-B-L2]|uniref:Prenylated flavin chaperone LpdD-like domain-containing protein n=1 Tax=Clostridium aromativorans TaxID=2836848 RepID=A0ABS8NA23_9CLOT|nr:hypothetical protein [Clostridium aromativorans]MCC9296663.1 hypothetical protein [Clostridium aromativorans]